MGLSTTHAAAAHQELARGMGAAVPGERSAAAGKQTGDEKEGVKIH